MLLTVANGVGNIMTVLANPKLPFTPLLDTLRGVPFPVYTMLVFSFSIDAGPASDTVGVGKGKFIPHVVSNGAWVGDRKPPLSHVGCTTL